MTAENFEAVFERLMNRRPFQIFTVELRGGQRFEVDAPLSMAVKDGIAVFIAPAKVPIWFDHTSVNQVIEARSDSAA